MKRLVTNFNREMKGGNKMKKINLIPKNKSGKSKMKAGGIIAIILVGAVVLGLLAWLFTSGVLQSTTGGNNGGNVGTAGCNLAPSVNLLAKNTLVAGTTPSISANYSIYKGAYVGSIPTALSEGASLDVLATATNYLNAEAKIDKLTCDGNDLSLDFVPYQIATYKVYDDSYNALTDNVAGGAVNITGGSNQVTTVVKVSGTPDKSTGDMLLCVEYANKTQVTTSGINLAGTGVARVDVPSWYTVAGTGSATACFTIPAVVNGGSDSYDLTFKPESSQVINGTGIYTTIYALNPVILDTQTGTFQTTQTWKDSLNADKTIANTDYDAYVSLN